MINTKNIVKLIYLYLFSLVGLVLIIIASVTLIDLGLKAFIFKSADTYISYPEYPTEKITISEDKVVSGTQIQEITEEQKVEYEAKQLEYQKENTERQRQRTASNSLAMFIVGIPLFLYHWKQIKRNK